MIAQVPGEGEVVANLDPSQRPYCDLGSPRLIRVGPTPDGHPSTTRLRCGAVCEQRAEIDQGVPPTTCTLDLVETGAAGPARRSGQQQLRVDQTCDDELDQAVGQPGVRGEHPHRDQVVSVWRPVGDAGDDLDEVAVAEHR